MGGALVGADNLEGLAHEDLEFLAGARLDVRLIRCGRVVVGLGTHDGRARVLDQQGTFWSAAAFTFAATSLDSAWPFERGGRFCVLLELERAISRSGRSRLRTPPIIRPPCR